MGEGTCDAASVGMRGGVQRRWASRHRGEGGMGVGDRYPPGPLEGERPLHGATDQLPHKVVSSWAGHRLHVKWTGPRGQWAHARIVRGLRTILGGSSVFPAPDALEGRR
jgi:hypothetical protein